ncbi:MAG: hypothetical protein IKI84_09670 [Clostridia bacterium]|nr:hypothetical protein [Clostridia bacterium]
MSQYSEQNEQNDRKPENPAKGIFRGMWNGGCKLRLGIILIGFASPAGIAILVWGLITGRKELLMGGFMSLFFLGLWGSLVLAGRQQMKMQREGCSWPMTAWGWRYVLAVVGLWSFGGLLLGSFALENVKLEPLMFIPLLFEFVLIFGMPLILHLIRKGRQGPKVIWWQALLMIVGAARIFGGTGLITSFRAIGETSVPIFVMAVADTVLGVVLTVPFFRRQTRPREED